MGPEKTRAYAAVEGVPGPLEVEAQEAAEAGMDWTGITIALITALLGGGAIGNWIQARTAGRKADVDKFTALVSGYKDQVALLDKRVVDLIAGQEADRARIAALERESSRERHIRSRAVRIAHQALDRADDQSVYIHRREEVRLEHDPDGTVTDWVPKIPTHLADREWTSRKRAELNALDELPLNDED